MGGCAEEAPTEKPLTPCKLHNCADGCQGCTKAHQLETRAIDNRGIDTEDTVGYTKEDLDKETSRCMDCGCLAVNPSDMANILIALNAVVKTSERTLTLEELMTADPCVEKTLRPGELLLEIVVPKPVAGTVVKYQKFRLRDSIDFAISAVASAYTVKDDVITDAKLVLGAVAPIPMRMKDVEKFLIGKTVSESVAAEAADLALAGAHPLSENKYKIDITKTLVRRSFD